MHFEKKKTVSHTYLLRKQKLFSAFALCPQRYIPTDSGSGMALERTHFIFNLDKFSVLSLEKQKH